MLVSHETCGYTCSVHRLHSLILVGCSILWHAISACDGIVTAKQYVSNSYSATISHLLSLYLHLVLIRWDLLVLSSVLLCLILSHSFCHRSILSLIMILFFSHSVAQVEGWMCLSPILFAFIAPPFGIHNFLPLIIFAKGLDVAEGNFRLHGGYFHVLLLNRFIEIFFDCFVASSIRFAEPKAVESWR